jgi:hypothetical protein
VYAAERLTYRQGNKMKIGGLDMTSNLKVIVFAALAASPAMASSHAREPFCAG